MVKTHGQASPRICGKHTSLEILPNGKDAMVKLHPARVVSTRVLKSTRPTAKTHGQASPRTCGKHTCLGNPDQRQRPHGQASPRTCGKHTCLEIRTNGKDAMVKLHTARVASTPVSKSGPTANDDTLMTLV